MPRHKIAILDKFGNIASTINGIQVAGPAVGPTGINYFPEGSISSGIGTASFDVPMQPAQNSAIQKNTHIMIYQEDVADGPVFWGKVIKNPKSFTSSGLSMHVECIDVLSELASLTVTSGFISRPDELASAMLNRLVALQTETAWTVRNTLPNIPANFNAYGIEILRAIGKYCGEHFASYKRETYIDPVTHRPGRRIVIGQFALINSGIRIIEAPKELASVPYDKRPKEIRYVKSATYDDDATIYNRLIPTMGSDINAAQMNLGILYNRTNFVGYNSAYPVKRRLRQDVILPTPLPGIDYPIQSYEFYIEDVTSIAANRISEIVYPRTDIVPLSTNPGDLEVAATTLYSAAVNYLIDHVNPHFTFKIVTDYRGDNRNLGGTLVYVRTRAVNEKKQYVIDVEGNYRVQSVEITSADSEGNCNWTITTDGRSIETDDTLFQGAVEELDYQRKVPTVLVAYPFYPIDDFIDGFTPLHIPFPNSDAFLSTQQVILDLRLVEVRSALRPLSHQHSFSLLDHSHTFTLLDHTHNITLLDHQHKVTLLDHAHTVTLGDHYHNAGASDHAHFVSKGGHTHTVNVGAHSHSITGTTIFLDPKAANAIVKANVGKNGESVVTDVTAQTYGNHTHGQGASGGANYTTSPSTAADGAISQNSNGGGGFLVNTSTHTGDSIASGGGGAFNGDSGGGGATNGNTGGGGAVAAGLTGGAGGLTGGTGGEVGAEWGLIVGPKPAIISVVVNGVSYGFYDRDLRIDITAAWKTKGDNVLDLTSPFQATNPTGLGRVRGGIFARMLGTTLANQSL